MQLIRSYKLMCTLEAAPQTRQLAAQSASLHQQIFRRPYAGGFAAGWHVSCVSAAHFLMTAAAGTGFTVRSLLLFTAIGYAMAQLPFGDDVAIPEPCKEFFPREYQNSVSKHTGAFLPRYNNIA